MPRIAQSILASFGLVTLATLGPLACTDDTVDPVGECDLLAGDLVITEIVANVPGADKGLEWFEIYNASANPIDLEGRTLVYSKVDGTGLKSHTIARSLELAPGAYVVVGSMLDELTQDIAHLDYGYGGDLGDFGNSGGYLAVGCGDEVIDEAYYVDALETGSRALDGSAVPDAVANDFLDNWCHSKTEMTPGFAATPGAKNDVCGSQTTCLQGGEEVPVVRPALGDLVITEVMPDPKAVGDDVGEWFEFRSLASAEFHLNGVGIGKDPQADALETIADEQCIVIAPGSVSVIAANLDAMINGGVPSESIVWETGITMTNSNSSLWLGADGEVLDAVTWGNVAAGKARQLDPDFNEPAANDELGNWCVATEPYGDGDLGTPGADNLQCPIAPPDGQCNANGELRDIVPLEHGALVISEYLPNPEAVADADGEWFEVIVKGEGDLNGLEIGKAGAVNDTIVGEDCIAVTAGDVLVFARDSDELVNGGLPQVDLVFDMSLNNSGSDLFIGYAGEVWDAVTWNSSAAGQSRSLDSGHFTVEANDDEANWCNGIGVYGGGDQGTPGQLNPACDGGPSEDTCLDPDTNAMRMINPPAAGELVLSEVMPNPSTAEPGGEWFELYASADFDLNGLELGKGGAVSHEVSSAECLEVAANSYVVLARSDVDGQNCSLPEVAYVYAGLALSNSNNDLQVGYAGEVLDEHAWAATSNGVGLSYDMADMSWCAAVDAFGCGDLGTPGAANPACDGGMSMEGQCFDGIEMRDIVVPSPGELIISEFMANPKVVSDAAGEWFELRALADFDLNGLEIGGAFSDGPETTIGGSDCIALVANDTALIARNSDPLINGGLPPVASTFSFNLVNGGGSLHVAAAGVLLDEITWSSTVADGKSTSLDPGSYDPDLNDVANNADANWCYSATPYSADNDGTPGADNEQCG